MKEVLGDLTACRPHWLQQLLTLAGHESYCAYSQTVGPGVCSAAFSPSSASSASRCSPGQISYWRVHSQQPQTHSGGLADALSSGGLPSYKSECRSL